MKRLLLQHTSRGAALDRYATIRTFFRQQPVSLSRTTSATYRSPVIQSYTLRTRITLRPFSAGRYLRQQGQGQSTRQPNADDKPPGKDEEPPPPKESPVGLENYPRFFRRLAMSLPNLQRPTRDDFLRAADGFWQRLRVRFRWLTIRSFRRYNADEMSAFFTWFLMSQTLWLFVGT